jgi:hypothetical protein
MCDMHAHPEGIRSIVPEPLADALARVATAPIAVLGLGIPRCPATQMLPASLTVVANVRTDLPIALGILSRPEEWGARETELWPRRIHISRSVVPILVVLREGLAIATRRGGASAYVIDTWLADAAGLPPTQLAEPWADDEHDELARLAARRAQHAAVTGRAAVD